MARQGKYQGCTEQVDVAAPVQSQGTLRAADGSRKAPSHQALVRLLWGRHAQPAEQPAHGGRSGMQDSLAAWGKPCL